MSKARKDYDVYAKLNMEISITIKAENIEDALAQSKDLKESDFVDILGEYMDGNIEIIGTMKRTQCGGR